MPKEINKKDVIPSDENTKLLETVEKHIWLLDSGASRHLCCHREWFAELETRRDLVYLGDTTVNVEGQGKVYIKRLVNGQWLNGVINDVLFVPSLKKNLFSVGVCMKNGYTINFTNNTVQISDRDNNVKAEGMQ